MAFELLIDSLREGEGGGLYYHVTMSRDTALFWCMLNLINGTNCNVNLKYSLTIYMYEKV